MNENESTQPHETVPPEPPTDPLIYMTRALERWEAGASDPEAGGAHTEAALRMMEVFALAAIAHDLHHLRYELRRPQLQTRSCGARRLGLGSKGSTADSYCVRRDGHIGDHVDAAGRRWGPDA